MIFLLLGCLGNRHLHQLQKLDLPSDIPLLLHTIESAEHSYLRKEAAEILANTPTESWTKDTVTVLQECVENSSEYSYVRTTCAQALAKAREYEAAESIVNAMNECDDESRYWMLLALEELAANSAVARGQIAELQNDSDLFIAAESQRWIREQK